MTELRATYRLQLTSGFGFAEARALVPYLAELGVSHLYLPPSFQARDGLHPRLRRRRPGLDLGRAGRRGGVPRAGRAPRARRAWGSCSTSSPTTWRWTTRTATGPTRSCGEQFFDIDPETGRHRRFFDVDHLAGVRQEDDEVFEETHRLALALVREGTVDGLRIDHPDGLADPAGYLRRLRDAGVEHVWVEKILDPGEQLRDWPVDGTVGYEFLNDAAALFVDPAGEAPLTELWERAVGRRPRASPSTRSRPSSSRRGPRSSPRSSGCAGEAPRRLTGAGARARVAAGLPHLRRAVVGAGRGRRPRGGRRGGAPGLAGAAAAARGARGGRVRHPLPADVAAGGGQGRRGHGLLPLRPPARAQRRRRRPGALRHARWRTSTRPTRIRAERFPRGLLVTQTHDTKRSGDVRARIGALAVDARRVGGARAGVAAAHAPAASRGGAPDDAERSFVFQTLVGAWPLRARAARGLHGEGAARGQAHDQLDLRRTRTGRQRVQAFCAGLYDAPRVPRRLRAVRGGGRARGRPDGARPAAAEADRAGDPRHLPGRRAARGSRWSTRTTAAPVDWERRREALAVRCAPAAPRGPQAVADRARAGAARAAARGVRGLVRAAGGGRRRVRVRARRRGRGGGRRATAAAVEVELPRRLVAGRPRRRRGRLPTSALRTSCSSCAPPRPGAAVHLAGVPGVGRRPHPPRRRADRVLRAALLRPAGAAADGRVRARLRRRRGPLADRAHRVRERPAGAAGRPGAARAHGRRVARRRRADRLRLDPRPDRRGAAA